MLNSILRDTFVQSVTCSLRFVSFLVSHESIVPKAG